MSKVYIRSLIKYTTAIFILIPLMLFSEGVYSVITSKMPQSAYVGAYFVDVDSGKVIVQYNENNLFVPASLT
ncbi:MAG TPA: D-alanyl-D-alanine carboxypeptidase, partial [Fervidobacterium sp.]|nr:D-alanyl-D-alanine carboxypeptidase [Fervidobacterium sp.]